jgi:hypothetical protein
VLHDALYHAWTYDRAKLQDTSITLEAYSRAAGFSKSNLDKYRTYWSKVKNEGEQWRKDI